MARCNHGNRTEDCKCRQLFHVYISSNHAGYTNNISVPGNLDKLFQGKTIREKRIILNELRITFKRFMEDANEIAKLNQETK